MDDREDFEKSRRYDATRMSKDPFSSELAAKLFAASDVYGYSYQWNWLGLPIIQLPADMVALQEIIWESTPDVVVELGVARGGSLIFYSSILHLVGKGRVVGVDIDIREHNRGAIVSHPMADRITLIEGSSVDPATSERVRAEIGAQDRVMVVLDSNHTHEHVARELELYAPLVTEGQFLVVADTIVEEIPAQTHRRREWGPGNNPATALAEFLSSTDRFEPDPWINSKLLLTNSPGGYLRCTKP